MGISIGNMVGIGGRTVCPVFISHMKAMGDQLQDPAVDQLLCFLTGR